MDFGSELVYVYNRSDSESVSDDSADEEVSSPAPRGFTRPVRTSSAAKKKRSFSASLKNIFSGSSWRSTGEQQAAEEATVPAVNIAPERQLDSAAGSSERPVPPPPVPRVAAKKTKKVRKADPNIITVNVGSLVEPKNLQTGNKYIECGNCNAVVTLRSKFDVDQIGGTNHWRCDFCEKENFNVDTTSWVKPAADDVTYLLESAPVVDQEKVKADEHNVIFVIDTSGSMSTTEQVDHMDANGRTTRTFVSRLDAVKTAAEHQILDLSRDSPNVKVGLVSFATTVFSLGDGSTAPTHLSDTAAATEEQLLEFGGSQPPLKPLSQTSGQVLSALSKLHDSGTTALGPGLLVAIAQAATRPGSKIIICTDGCANRGIGTLPGPNADEDVVSRCRAVYRKISELARESSVEISVISLAGTDCRLVHLGMVAQMTGGVVDIVDQSNLTNRFRNILSSRTLATNVTATIQLYHMLYIRDENQSVQQSSRVEIIGNASADTDMILEFGVRRPEYDNEEPVPAEVEDEQDRTDASASHLTNLPSSLPFQTRVIFTARDGAKYLRVVTTDRQSTNERSKAEAAMNIDVVGAATTKTVSDIALTGAVRKAKDNVKGHRKMAARYCSSKSSTGIDEGMYTDQLTELAVMTNVAPQANSAMAQNRMSDTHSKYFLSRAKKSKAGYAAEKQAYIQRLQGRQSPNSSSLSNNM